MAKRSDITKGTNDNTVTEESSSMSNGHSTTGNASGLETGLARTIKVGKQELLIVKMVHTRGRDVEEGDYPVVVVKGQRTRWGPAQA